MGWPPPYHLRAADLSYDLAALERKSGIRRDVSGGLGRGSAVVCRRADCRCDLGWAVGFRLRSWPSGWPSGGMQWGDPVRVLGGGFEFGPVERAVRECSFGREL